MRHTVDAAAGLTECHRKIRQGDFRQGLLETVESQWPSWASFQPHERVLGAIVAAEVFDYNGRYQEAAEVLADFGAADEVLFAVRHPGKSQHRDLRKRQLWLVLAHAQVLYRDEDYRAARSLLEACAEVLEELDPNEERFLGTRARLALAMGQTHRQLDHYGPAIHQFAESIRFANARLQSNTDSGMTITDSDVDARRRLAHWTIARSLAFGTGWIRYTTGLLENATVCLNTGAALLSSTGDGIHRAYCQLLLAAVRRAKHAAKTGELQAAVGAIRKSAAALSAHPPFLIRAQYELALAYLHLKDTEQAGQTIGTLEQLVSNNTRFVDRSRRKSRWTCNVMILRSRLARLRGDFGEAERLARDAWKVARKNDHNGFEPDALIAAGEAAALMDSDPAAIDRAIKHFETARLRSESNPKTAGVCCLHLANVYKRRGDQARAQDEFARWHNLFEPIVEHGFVRQLASQVRAGLWPVNTLLLRGDNYAENDGLLKRALLAKTARKSKKDQALLLGVTEQTVWRWQKELGAASDNPTE